MTKPIPPYEGGKGNMIRPKILSKWILIVLPALLLGYFAFDKIMLSSQQQAESAGSARILWAAPTENEDDGPLTELNGYVIYYGTHAGQYSNMIVIDDPETTSYQIENLSPGTYYFAVTAINTDGLESTMSNMVVKKVR